MTKIQNPKQKLSATRADSSESQVYRSKFFRFRTLDNLNLEFAWNLNIGIWDLKPQVLDVER